MRKSVCVDLDGILAQYDSWKGVDVIGDPIPGAREFLQELSEKYSVVIHTTRTNPLANSEFIRNNKDVDGRQLRLIVEDWLVKHNMPFDSISMGEGKPIAIAYVDDRAVMCCPQKSSLAFENALLTIDHLAI